MAGNCGCFSFLASSEEIKKEEEPDPYVSIDVGGQIFKTKRVTLCTGDAQGSALEDLIAAGPDKKGNYFLDRDGTPFKLILMYLRDGQGALSGVAAGNGPVTFECLLHEAKCLRLMKLEQLLERRIFESRSGHDTRDQGPDTQGSISSIMKHSTGSGMHPASDFYGTPPFKDFKLKKLIGKGSFGAVYAATWNGAPVAVKIMQTMIKDGASESTKKQDFEAELSASISHPNLVRTFMCERTMADRSNEAAEFAEGAGTLAWTWIMQELCEGGSLADRCKLPRDKDEKLRHVLDILAEISRGMNYLHDRLIIHGDLTSKNVLTQQNTAAAKKFTCKVCDFGLSRVIDDENQEIVTRTMGTVTHQPPELFSADPEKCRLTQKADVYALGIIMYHVITAKIPWAKMSQAQVVLNVARGGKLQLPEGIPHRMQDLYNRCLALEPQDRPSFTKVLDLLSEAIAEKG
eukprot:TRINITY_DN29134_c0_g2_i1.p1 TRINITY_DN29134_c0_g2~~TRINITY_DN29134_c0_g2_i1.p1  ORF type:complete len:461 (+),score=75.23 TRINITY_DN29134_c0_g2_i1:55-1437(+)